MARIWALIARFLTIYAIGITSRASYTLAKECERRAYPINGTIEPVRSFILMPFVRQSRMLATVMSLFTRLRLDHKSKRRSSALKLQVAAFMHDEDF